MLLFEPNWSLPQGIKLGWTRRQGGVSVAPFDTFNLAHHVGDDEAAVDRNRERLLNAMPGCRQIRWLSQVHGIAVRDPADTLDGSEADAAFTRQTGLACSVMTADCLPVFFWTDQADAVACAHAGWRGLAEGVLLETLACFDNPTQVRVGFGPAIGPGAFEVGDDVLQAFRGWPDRDDCFRPGVQPGKYLADLVGLAERQLRQAGVERFHRSDACTLTESEHYFSYRRDGQTGRMANLIWIQSASC